MRRAPLLALLALLPFSPADRAAVAADVSTADRVEEDWEIVVSTPDVGVTSPQVATAMAAGASGSAPTFEFALNYRDSPSFAAGGLQAKARDGDQVLATASEGSAQLATADETITWIQKLELSGGNLKFSIRSGSSTTWGGFGDDLSVDAATSLASLSGYDPAASVQDSGPSFGASRVSRMTLLRVRYYRGDQLLSTDSTARSVTLPE